MMTGMSLALVDSKMPCRKADKLNSVEGEKALCRQISTGEAREVKHLQWNEVFSCSSWNAGNDGVTAW